MKENIPDPQEFIESYGREAKVVIGKDMSTTLGEALDFEELMCDAPDDKHLDPVKRVGYIANMLSRADSLRPEDAHLVPRPE